MRVLDGTVTDPLFATQLVFRAKKGDDPTTSHQLMRNLTFAGASGRPCFRLKGCPARFHVNWCNGNSSKGPFRFQSLFSPKFKVLGRHMRPRCQVSAEIPMLCTGLHDVCLRFDREMPLEETWGTLWQTKLNKCNHHSPAAIPLRRGPT